MKARKIPLRQCVGCKDQKPKSDLIRVVKTKDQGIVLDKTGKINGRGAYLCYNPKCLESAYKSKALNRSLSTNISQELYEEMNDMLKSE